MEKPFILHVITPEKNVSPFDMNMAYDAGWTNTVPYTHVEMNEVKDLVQDAIFSRSSSSLKKTGIFFGIFIDKNLHDTFIIDIMKVKDKSPCLLLPLNKSGSIIEFKVILLAWNIRDG